MGEVISVGIQKGGVGKTTTTAVVSWILANHYGKKVLAIDFDSQGNLTQMLTQVEDTFDAFNGRMALDGIKAGNIEPYIVKTPANVDLLPATDLLSLLASWLYTNYRDRNEYVFALRKAMKSVRDKYDYILIDQPPNLGELCSNAVGAADWALVIMQTENFCYRAVDVYLEFLMLYGETFRGSEY